VTRGLLAPVVFAVAGALLAGCQSTQERSAEIGRSAKRLARETGLTITRRNADVRVGQHAVVQDRNGVAAVVELRNGGADQADVPVQVTVRDPRGKGIYSNTTPGLDPSLVSVPVLARREKVFWVDNQIVATGRAARLDVKVGAARTPAPSRVPRIEVSGLRLGHDTDGAFVKGVVRNRSSVTQRRLTVYCVAHRGGRVVAAGRATVDRLPPGPARKPTTFTIFFIGDPTGAKLEAAAPATVLE
jgi:hypothetical protein